MHEELFITDSFGTTAVQKVFTANETWIEWSELESKLKALSELDSPESRPALRALLLDLAFYSWEEKDAVNNRSASSSVTLAARQAISQAS